MGYKYSFVDNVSYGAEDINRIRRALATKGVIPETATSCQVVTGGTGKVIVMQGMAMFDDGSVIEVASGGVDLTIIPSVKNYVWFERSVITNNAEAKITTTPPAGDFVKLAEIEADGTIIDKREYGRMKMPTYDSVISNSTIYKYSAGKDTSGTNWVKVDEINLVIDFKKAVITGYRMQWSSSMFDVVRVVDFTTADAAGMSAVFGCELYGGYDYDVGFKKVGTTLEIWLKAESAGSRTYDIIFDGIFFV